MAAPKGNLYALGNTGGRPTEYDPKYCNEVEVFMSKGFSFEAFAGHLGVCKQTLYNWAEKNKEFMDAYNRAKDKCRLFWESIMLEHIVHTQRGKRVDPRMWEWNMKNRFKDEWKDEVTQHQHQTITEVTFTKKTRDEK